MKMIIIIFTLFTMTNLFASFQSQKTSDIKSDINCFAQKGGLADTFVQKSLEVQSKEVRSLILAYATGKGGGNFDGEFNDDSCRETEETGIEFLKRNKLQDQFNSITQKIEKLFPQIDLSKSINGIKLCKSRRPLNLVIKDVYVAEKEDKRRFIWMPDMAQGSNYIIYNGEADIKYMKENDVLLWAITKELLHEYTPGGEFHVRNYQLKIIVAKLQTYLKGEITKESLFAETDFYGWPTIK